VARAQQPELPVVGFLFSGSPELFADRLVLLREGLTDAGYLEGRNVAFEYRMAEDHYERLPELALDLVGRKVALILAVGSVQPALAAKRATTTIPIVFAFGTDPVARGLAPNFNRPGANITVAAGTNSCSSDRRFAAAAGRLRLAAKPS
jgi:putative tryptophan/tyrosine transport system substrate-binding protein